LKHFYVFFDYIKTNQSYLIKLTPISSDNQALYWAKHPHCWVVAILLCKIKYMINKALAREVLLWRKAQYGWPHCTNLFRSALFILKYYLLFFYKKTTLMRRSTVLSLPPQLVFPDLAQAAIYLKKTVNWNNIWKRKRLSLCSFKKNFSCAKYYITFTVIIYKYSQ
jgi:hypothetical protein